MKRKRRILWMLGTLIGFLFCIKVKAADTYPYTTPINMQTNVNAKIYMYDNMESAVLTVIPKGNYISVIGMTTQGFYVIDLGGAAGFIYADQVIKSNEEIGEIAQQDNMNPIVQISNREDQTYKIYQTEYQGIIDEQYGHLIIETGLSESEKIEGKRMYDYIPENVRKYLSDNQLVCIYTKDKNKFIDFPNVTSGYTKAVYLNGMKNINTFLVGNITCFAQNSNSILHEFGHAIDKTICKGNETGNLSHKKEFEMVYYAESPKAGLNSYYTKEVDEYFAECFNLYFTQTTYLQANMPQTYIFMKDLIENM